MGLSAGCDGGVDVVLGVGGMSVGTVGLSVTLYGGTLMLVVADWAVDECWSEGDGVGEMSCAAEAAGVDVGAACADADCVERTCDSVPECLCRGLALFNAPITDVLALHLPSEHQSLHV